MQDRTHLDPETLAASAAIAPAIFNHASISLAHQNNQLIECCVTCQIPLDVYQTIEKYSLFNLKPELRSHKITFSPDTEIALKVTLSPDLWEEIAEHAATPEAALQYLQQLSSTQPNHPLLNFDNWFALSAHQDNLSYTTLWATLNPSKLATGTLSEAEFTQALSQFLTELTTTELTKATDRFLNDLFSDFTNTFKPDRNIVGSTPITNIMVAFFTQDDWPFTKIQGQPILQMMCQGENGQWLCYARANEAPAQFAFYSICPAAAPADRRLAIAEFITRANSGMVIGNFELNFDNGEILYKTSIDVEGDRLTPSLIKQMVYTNISLMDKYLPGIQAVINGEIPTDAILTVETLDELA